MGCDDGGSYVWSENYQEITSQICVEKIILSAVICSGISLVLASLFCANLCYIVTCRESPDQLSTCFCVTGSVTKKCTILVHVETIYYIPITSLL